jgi:hypothetical protein
MKRNRLGQACFLAGCLSSLPPLTSSVWSASADRLESAAGGPEAADSTFDGAPPVERPAILECDEPVVALPPERSARLRRADLLEEEPAATPQAAKTQDDEAFGSAALFGGVGAVLIFLAFMISDAAIGCVGGVFLIGALFELPDGLDGLSKDGPGSDV